MVAFSMFADGSEYPAKCVTYNDKDEMPPTLPWCYICSQAGTLGDTGFEEDILTDLWLKYRGCLPYRERAKKRTQVYWYLGYVYIHFMPTKGQFKRVMTSPLLKGCISYSTFRKSVVPVMECYAAELMKGGEIDWSRRLNPTNHHEFFPRYVTTIADCGPMVVWEPTDPEMHRLLNQGTNAA